MFPRAHLSRLWAEHPYFDAETRSEIAATTNTAELEDRFYKDLEFGTGGLRGLIGAGTNRMNRYTVRQATQGLAAYIKQQGRREAARSVVIAYDSRYLSYEFALEAALVLNANGIPAYLWESLRPTPMLSFAVRELGATAGIVITASHNPPQYNGYKVYWQDGGQVPPELARAIQEEIRGITDITSIRPMDEAEARERGLLRDVPRWVDDRYTERLLGLLTVDGGLRAGCNVLYTPLHGTGSIPVRRVLTEAGFHVTVVPEQEHPDANFPTVAYPNPEEPKVFELALRRAAVEEPDVIMATDPDADRLGVMARDRAGQYRLLSGNHLGALLVDYLLSRRAAMGTLPVNGAVVKTIATSNLVVPMCREYGVSVVNTHTGFKFIGDKIHEWEETGEHSFLFGFEESYGYLGATFVRDKDAVMAALLVAEATAHHKSKGRTLYEALERIWAQYGYFAEDLHSVTLPGKEGQAAIARMMADLRRASPRAFGGVPVCCTDDYASGVGFDHRRGATYGLTLGRADVLHYRFADGGFVMVRPSGTEPKLKVYLSTAGASLPESQARLQKVKADTLSRLGLKA